VEEEEEAMAMTETDFTPFVEEIFNELQSGLSPGTLMTAMMKAAWRGVMRGIAITTHAINESTPEVDVQTWFHGLDGDIGEPDL
jgi:hypothetical protein